ncbi:Heparinase II/III family protein, partial [Candidatus Thiomargarita nelsonii]
MSEMFSGITANYLQHRFDLLGSGWVQVKHGMSCRGLEGYRYEMGNSTPTVNAANLAESKRILALIDNDYTLIDWHLDFKSGYRWSEATWYQDITYGHKLGVDVKVPWELARMQHLPQLAFQYALTDKDQIYPREFRNQVLDFMATNPPRFGVNWCCTMDVGIRVANWLVAYDLFCAYGAEFDETFLKLFKRSVYEHGRHIINNLEWYPDLRSNHYLSDIIGLLYVAAYLPATSEVDAWLAFAVDEVIKEVKTQFHPDGSNFEASTSYHRLSGELVIYATLLILSLPKSLPKFPDWYIKRLQKIAEFTMDITRPDGLIPQIGDNDSGRFLKLFPVYKKLTVAEAKARYLYWMEEGLDHRHLVAAINALFEREDLTKFAGTASIESNVLKPKQSFKVLKRQENHYPDFGLFIYKTQRIYLIVRCGSVGQNGNGGHAHNDQLSFELCVDGVPFIVDPGTYIYTPLPKRRNAFRATASHNTLIVEGKEQNQLEETQLFALPDKAYAKVTEQSEYKIKMEHRGFGKV